MGGNMAGKTQENLMKAITGESLARNKYTFFAIRARKDGYEGIARIFEETAGNEMEHAERELEFVKDKVTADAKPEIAPIGSTAENLKAAAAGEKYEWGTMYPDFLKDAKDEGEEEIAKVFKEIGEVEEKHEQRYRALIKHVEDGTVFKRETEIEWKCLNCGYVHKGTEAPEKCPSCDKPQAWYEPRAYNWK
jgi:rubrerythrin